MAEKKKKKIISADTGLEVEAGSRKKEKMKQAAPVGNAGGLRAGAVALWVAALVCEIVAVMIYSGKINWTFVATIWQIIAALMLDLALVVTGAQLWKKANHIKPASEKNKFTFWLWNNMGVVACAVCFIPFIIIALLNKETDKKTKTVAVAVAVVALLISGVASYDWNPVSEEMQQAAINAIADDVYWSPFGKVYHTHDDCQSLNQSDQLTYGTVEQAIAENRTRLCSFCAKRDDITGVATDDVDVSDYVVEDEVSDDTAETEEAA
ncbi:MAG: hypothetical protein J6C04_09095 [Oscillospiraceae bacterium]|nr:hypothetical protein [Oscillospiraceae bacterium]